MELITSVSPTKLYIYFDEGRINYSSTWSGCEVNCFALLKDSLVAIVFLVPMTFQDLGVYSKLFCEINWLCGFPHLQILVSTICVFGIVIVCFVLMIGLGINLSLTNAQDSLCFSSCPFLGVTNLDVISQGAFSSMVADSIFITVVMSVELATLNILGTSIRSFPSLPTPESPSIL